MVADLAGLLDAGWVPAIPSGGFALLASAALAMASNATGNAIAAAEAKDLCYLLSKVPGDRVEIYRGIIANPETVPCKDMADD